MKSRTPGRVLCASCNALTSTRGTLRGMTTHAAHSTPLTAAWPTNLGAYATAITGAIPLLPAGLITGATLDAPTLAAFATATAGHIALLLTANPTLKRVASWAGTVAAAGILAAAQYEGAPALSWGTFAQWDTSDVATVLMLTIASVLHTVVPNTPAQYATTDTAHDDAEAMPAPPVADTTPAIPVQQESVTSILTAVRASQAAESREEVTA